MSETFLINILIMLVLAVILGEIFHRIKLPSLVGHLLAGVIIGPSVLNIVQPSESFSIVIDLAVFFLMFLAGLELRPEEIIKAGKKSFFLSVISFVIPFVAGTLVSDLLGFSLITSFFVGLTLAITAIPVSAVILMEFGLLKSRLGNTVMTAGVIDDILSLIVLAIIIQLSHNGIEELDYGEVGFSIFKIIAFLLGIFAFDLVIRKKGKWLPNKIKSVSEKLKTREVGFALLLISGFGLSIIAEKVGLHFVIGTFFAGLIVYKQIIGNDNFDKVNVVFSAITFGLFSPIFFAFIGTEFHIQSIINELPLFILLLAVAIAGKLSGGFIGGRIAGFSKSESMAIGHLVNARGMVELVIASIGLELGIIDLPLFSVIVAVGFATTIIAPIMARVSLKRSRVLRDDTNMT